MSPLIQSLVSSKLSLATKSITLKQTLHCFSFLLFYSSHNVNPPQSPIPSLLLSNKPLEAARLLHNTTSPLPPTLYNSTVAALSANGLIGPAHNLFDRMFERKVIFNDVGFGCFVKKLCEYEGLGKIVSLVEGVIEMGCGINGSVMAVMIVDGLCRAGKIEEAWEALGELRVIGWKPDFIAYRIVSEGFRLANRVEEFGRILKQKRKFGVAPRINDYREFIFWLVSEQRIQEAKELGEAIVYGDFPIDDDVLDCLIGSVSNFDMDSAMLLLKYVMKKGRLPTITLLKHLSTNLSKTANGDVMWNFFTILSDKDYFSGVEQYNLKVTFLCTVGKLREAYDVLKEMKKKGSPPDISTYNCLMEACCREDLVRPAKKLWDEMFASGCSPDLTTYNILIGKLLDIGEVKEAQHLFHHMMGKGLKPGYATYKMLIRVLCQEKNVEGAVGIFYKSFEQDLALAKSTLGTLILALCEGGMFFRSDGNYACNQGAVVMKIENV